MDQKLKIRAGRTELCILCPFSTRLPPAGAGVLSCPRLLCADLSLLHFVVLILYTFEHQPLNDATIAGSVHQILPQIKQDAVDNEKQAPVDDERCTKSLSAKEFWHAQWKNSLCFKVCATGMC